MKKLTQEQAEFLRRKRYTHIAAIVKSIGYSKYYNVNRIDDIMENGGKWIPAESIPHTFKNGYTGNIKMGTIGTKIDWSQTVARGFATYLINLWWR